MVVAQVLFGTVLGRKILGPFGSSDNDADNIIPAADLDPEKGEEGSSSTKDGPNGEGSSGGDGDGNAAEGADGQEPDRPLTKREQRQRRDKGAVHRWSPVFAGMCCPFSILLEIPGLTDKWYIRTTEAGGGGEIVETQPNSALLDTALAVSISFAALANIALICRFLEKKPRLSTIITIISLTTHDVINIVVVTVFGIVHSKSDGFTYSQSFFMTVASSTVSTVCNVTLITDFIWVDNFKEKGSGLTTKQRSLVISCMALLCYLAVGSLVFSLIESPKLSFQDALYFTIVTVATIGYGDIVPDTLASKLFFFPFETVGIILLTVTIAMARETIIESFEASYRSRRDAVLRRTKERREQKRRDRAARRARAHSIVIRDPNAPATSDLDATAAQVPHAEFDHHDDDDVSIIEVAWWRRAWHRVHVLFARVTRKEPPMHPKQKLMLARTITQRSMQEEDSLQKFKSRLALEQRREFLIKLTVAGTLFIAFWLVGAGVFTKTDGWNFGDSLYFCYVTFVTVGYGDFSPKTPAGRGFFIAWALFGIATMTILLSVLIEGWKTRYSTAINSSKSGVTLADRMRKLQLRSRAAQAQKKAAEAKANGEAPAQSPIVAEPEEDDRDIATKLLDSARGFSRHAQYWMNYKSGNPPEELQRLVDETDELAGQEDMKELRAIAQSAPEGSTQDLLFVISYARSFELLLESADQAVEMLRERERELEHLRILTSHLEGVLDSAKTAEAASRPATGPKKPTRLGTLFATKTRLDDVGGSSLRRTSTRQTIGDGALSEEPEGMDDIYSPSTLSSIEVKDYAFPTDDGASVHDGDSPHRAALHSARSALSKYADSNSSAAPSLRESVTPAPHHHRLRNVAKAVAWMRHPHHKDTRVEKKIASPHIQTTPTQSRPTTPTPTPRPETSQQFPRSLSFQEPVKDGKEKVKEADQENE